MQIWMALIGLSGALLGAVLGAFVSHWLHVRSKRREARRETEETERAKAYVPVERLLELAADAIELFQWPHSSKWGKTHSAGACQRLKSETLRLVPRIRASMASKLLDLMPPGPGTVFEILMFMDEMSRTHSQDERLKQDVLDKINDAIDTLNREILKGKMMRAAQ